MENSLSDEGAIFNSKPPQDVPQSANEEDGIGRFIEQMGLYAQGDGVARIAGRLFGYFIVHGGPVSFADLAEALQVSRASVSTNARTLVSIGMIVRVTRPGDRQDYYQLAESPFSRMIETYIARMRAMQEILQQADRTIPQNMAATHRRLAQMSDFYSVAVQSNEQMLKELEQ